MKDVEELLKAVIAKSGDGDGSYLYGVEYSSETTPGYNAVVRFSKDGVQAAVFAAKSKRELKKSIKRYLDGDELKDVNIRYHQAQIEREQQVIRFHEQLIQDYENAGPHSKLPTE